uniref:Methionine-r-sulfoxide reductase n=1 Tax=Tetraselmis sp. GSL018 TaxID=582737 RepID=A0A061RVL8_9CHLO
MRTFSCSPRLPLLRAPAATYRTVKKSREAPLVRACQRDSQKSYPEESRRAVLLGASAVASSLASFSEFSSASAESVGGEFASPNALAILNREGEISHTTEEWQQILTKQQYRVLREEGTELPFSR